MSYPGAITPLYFTVVSVEGSDDAASLTVPTGAKFADVVTDELWYIHGGDYHPNVGDSDTVVTPGATNRFPVNADEPVIGMPCARMTNIHVSKQSSNFTKLAVRWFF